MLGSQCVPYSAKAAVNGAQQEDQGEYNAHDQHGALNEVSPENGFQTAGVGIDDGDDTHDQNQEVHADACQAGQHHAGQVHDDGHAPDLIHDEHHGAQNAQGFGAEAQFQIVVGGVDVQLGVNRQEEADGQGNRDEHSQLGKPHDPGPGIGVARQGQEGKSATAASRRWIRIFTHQGMVPSPLKYSLPFMSFLAKNRPATRTAPR